MIYVPLQKIFSCPAAVCKDTRCKIFPTYPKDLFHVLLCQTFFDESHSNLEKNELVIVDINI